VWLGVFSLPVAGAAIEVEDFTGRTVQLEAPAQRIVALAPDIVENVFSAGAGAKLVGAVAYSDYPSGASDIPRVGNFQSWSVEAVVALKPDLVILWGSGNGTGSLAVFEQLGIPVFVSELRQLADIPSVIRAIGTLAGTQTTSAPEATRLENAFEALRREYSRDDPVSVFYQIWNEPLQTVNGEHLISQLIALCGGYNVFGDAPSLAPKINIEAVLARDPEAIVASGMATARPEWLDDWRRYTSLRAVDADALFFVPPDYLQRPTARILTGATTLCDQLAGVR
jgi:iron complex transport system substrate-binding protein